MGDEKDLTSWSAEQIEKHLQGWKDIFAEYKKFDNRSVIREAKRIIREFEVELKSRKEVAR